MPLRPYQRRASDAAYRRYQERGELRVVLGLGTGLGKTVISIDLLKRIGIPADSYALILVPKSKVRDWKEELCHWWPESARRIFLADGSTADRYATIKKHARNGNVLIANHYTVENGKHTRHVYNFIRKNPPNIMIVDEAHKLSLKSTSLRSRNRFSRALSRFDVPNRLALTATSVDKAEYEVYGILHWMDPDEYPMTYADFWYWAEQYCDFQESFVHSGKEYVGIRGTLEGDEALMRRTYERLHRELGRYFITIKKGEDAPRAKVYAKAFPMTEAQEETYIQFEQENMALVGGVPVVCPNEAVTLLRLLQTTISPALVTETWREEDGTLNSQPIPTAPKDSPKIDYLVRVAHERTTPFVVYSPYKRAINLLEEKLIESGFPAERIVRVTGDENESQREAACSAINSGKATVALLTSAGGEGINLQGANEIFYLGLPMTHREFKQVIGRIERINTAHASLRATILVVPGTVDEWNLRLLHGKKNVSTKMLIEMVFNNPYRERKAA